MDKGSARARALVIGQWVGWAALLVAAVAVVTHSDDAFESGLLPWVDAPEDEAREPPPPASPAAPATEPGRAPPRLTPLPASPPPPATNAAEPPPTSAAPVGAPDASGAGTGAEVDPGVASPLPIENDVGVEVAVRPPLRIDASTEIGAASPPSLLRVEADLKVSVETTLEGASTVGADTAASGTLTATGAATAPTAEAVADIGAAATTAPPLETVDATRAADSQRSSPLGPLAGR